MSRRKKSKRPEAGRPHEGDPPRGVPWGRLLGRRRAAALAAIALVVVLLAAAFLVRSLTSGGSPSGPRTAAIVDQLSLTQPNPEFAASATAILEQAGYSVDYYPGEEVTVDFYRELATQDYDYLILRTHAARRKQDENTYTEEVDLFTSELYTQTKYDEDRKNRRLSAAFYYQGGTEYFGVTPAFVEESIDGTFDGAMVMMMGCGGLRSNEMADAFLGKGAKAFVSWNDDVSASHTDAATERLLELLLLDEVATQAAVSQTAAEFGSDPYSGAELRIKMDEG